LLANPASLTAQYLSGSLRIPVPKRRVVPSQWLTVCGATENNLAGLDASFPLGVSRA